MPARSGGKIADADQNRSALRGETLDRERNAEGDTVFKLSHDDV
jgi:hypothetical protein